jgi:acyl-coenzyme A thioesterase PaaI-like protein
MPYDATKNTVVRGAAIASLTDNTGGTASNTLADVPTTYTEATMANQLASLTAKINAILAAMRASNDIAS